MPPQVLGWGEGVRVDAQCSPLLLLSLQPPGLPEALCPPNPGSGPLPPALNEGNLPCSPWGPVGREKGAVRTRAALASHSANTCFPTVPGALQTPKAEMGETDGIYSL